jgi:DNA-binding response OmpR family regulator
MPRTLIAEHDPAIRKVICAQLQAAGFDVVESTEGAGALRLLRRQPFDLIVLDVVLPGVDGVSVCRGVREGGLNADVPILMVSADGIEPGRPFDLSEFQARVAAVTRHVSKGPVRIDVDKRRVTVRGRPIALTRQEFNVLLRLATRRGIVFSRAALLRNVWTHGARVTERTVDSVISRLRRKIELNPRNPELILTDWGVGYKFAEGS